MSVAENVRSIRERIARAAERVGRSPDEVTLVAVTKSTDAAGIRAAFEAGVTHFGENRLQKAVRRLAELPDLRARTTWHMVGHLQSNKAKSSIQVFDIIQSVDSVRLGETLDRRADRPIPVFLEVNVAGETSKYGFRPEELAEAYRAVSRLPKLAVRGLMTVAPQASEPESVRPVFRRLRELGQELGLPALSMGMTDDFDVAVEEGATVVRIGRAAVLGATEGEMKLGLVGGGVMAEAILSGVLNEGVALAGEIVVSDVAEARRKHLEATYGVTAVGDNGAAAKGADIVVLAVKPQNLGEVLGGLRGALADEQTVLSIVAGAPTRTIVGGLDHAAVVRAMPNTPAQLGQGITAWTATPEVTAARREDAKHVLSALGREVYLEDEKLIDVATALSGSGPAYVFLFIEALIEAGVFLGMPRDVAHQLAVHTVAGSGTMAVQTGENPAGLREKVTSPGGTTAEALLALEEGNFRATVMSAVIAAYEKAKELGAQS